MTPARTISLAVYWRTLSVVFLFAGILLSISSQAGHLWGSDIGYRFIDTGIYEIRLTLYRDCNGIQLSPPEMIVTDGTNKITYEATIHGAARDVTGLHSTCGPSRCAGGSHPYGFQLQDYLDTIDISAFSSCQWTVSFNHCCRPGSISTGAANQYHHNFCVLNQCIPNSSPSFEMPPIRTICVGRDQEIWQNVVDTIEVDDAFTYHPSEPYADSVSPISYTGNWSPLRPLTFLGFPNQNVIHPGGFSLSPSTGVYTFRPTQQNQVSVFVLEVREWRDINGTMTHIGTTRRDMIILVIACPNQGNYQNPNIEPVDRVHELCVKDSFCFEIQTNDADGDSTFIDWNGGLPDGVFTSTNGQEQHAKGTFCWKPINVNVSDTPYSFSIFVTDNACFVRGEYATTFFVYVRDSTDGPTVELGPDIIDSVGLDSFFVKGVLDDYNGQELRWHTTGDGTFSPPDNDSAYYIPGPLDHKTCSYELSLEIVDSTVCLGDSKLIDTLVVLQQHGAFSAGADFMMYPFDTVSLTPQVDTGRAWSYRWHTSGDGWLEADTFPFTRYSMGNVDLLECGTRLFLTRYGCDTVFDRVTVERDFLPVNAGPDIASVTSDSIVLQAILPAAYAQQGYWRTNGEGRFSDSSLANPVYYLDSSDWSSCSLAFIWEELPLAHCRDNADTLTASIHFTGLDAGPDQQVYVENTVYLSASPLIGPGPFGYWTSSGDGGFSDSTDPQAYYVPGIGDKAACGVTLYWNYPFATCHQETDSLKISFSYPVLNAGADQQLLFGDTLFVNASGDGSHWSSTGAGSWSDVQDSSSRYYPSGAEWTNCGGTVIWNARYPQCGQLSDSLSWKRIPFVVDAGPDQQVAQMDSLLLTASLLDNGRTQGWWTTMGDGHFLDSSNPQTTYYPGQTDKTNCGGQLIWNAPFTTCSPSADTLEWMSQPTLIDAGPDQILPIGSDVVLKGVSSASRIEWQSNGTGSFLDSSARGTIYYTAPSDQPLCSLSFYLHEIEAYCYLQSDTLTVFWTEEAASIEEVTFEECYMDSLRIRVEGPDYYTYSWSTDGGGVFEQDSLTGQWYYLPSKDDYSLSTIWLRMHASGLCQNNTDVVTVAINRRNDLNSWNINQGPIIVYPNPTTDWLHIDGAECAVEVVWIQVYDMLGQKVQSWNVEYLPFVQSIESLAQGTYILRIHLANGREEIVKITKYVR